MQKVTTAVLLSCLLVPVSHVPACADTAPPVPSPDRFNSKPVPRLHRFSINPATTQFLSAFTAYAQAVKDQGSQGVKKITTSDFALRQGNQSSQGEQAYKELAACMDDFPKKGYAVSVRPVSVSGTEAIALTRETFQMHLGSARGAVIYYGKQTWRMTPQGWKLAVIEIQDGKDFDNGYGFRFTTTSQAKENPAKV